MSRHAVVQGFAERAPVPGDPELAVEGDALTVDGWWPAALWVGPATCLVRLDEDAHAEVAGALAEALGAVGLVAVEADLEAPIEAVTIQRLGLMGARWQVWSTDADAARSSITQAASP